MNGSNIYIKCEGEESLFIDFIRDCELVFPFSFSVTPKQNFVLLLISSYFPWSAPTPYHGLPSSVKFLDQFLTATVAVNGIGKSYCLGELYCLNYYGNLIVLCFVYLMPKHNLITSSFF